MLGALVSCIDHPAVVRPSCHYQPLGPAPFNPANLPLLRSGRTPQMLRNRITGSAALSFPAKGSATSSAGLLCIPCRHFVTALELPDAAAQGSADASECFLDFLDPGSSGDCPGRPFRVGTCSNPLDSLNVSCCACALGLPEPQASSPATSIKVSQGALA